MHTFDSLRLLNLLVSLALLAMVVATRPGFVARCCGQVHAMLTTAATLLLLNALFGLASWEREVGGNYDQLKAIWLPLATRISLLAALVSWLRVRSPEGRSPSPSR